jgi:hypothetical protein
MKITAARLFRVAGAGRLDPAKIEDRHELEFDT